MKRAQWLMFVSAIPWIWASSAQAGGAEPPDPITAQVSRTALMLPMEFTGSVVPLAPVGLDLWLRVWLPPQVEVRKGMGLAMTHPVRVGQTDLQLGVAGPVMRKKNLGLTLEVRF